MAGVLWSRQAWFGAGMQPHGWASLVHPRQIPAAGTQRGDSLLANPARCKPPTPNKLPRANKPPIPQQPMPTTCMDTTPSWSRSASRSAASTVSGNCRRTRKAAPADWAPVLDGTNHVYIHPPTRLRPTASQPPHARTHLATPFAAQQLPQLPCLTAPILLKGAPCLCSCCRTHLAALLAAQQLLQLLR